MTTVTVAHLIRKLRSEESKYVLQAIEELRARGWLGDGSLAGVSLRHIHLEGADLYKAHLRKTDLSRANLAGADLSMADLQGACLEYADLQRADFSMANLSQADLYMANLAGARNLTDQQLSQAWRLWGATMPDGKPYAGQLNLDGDVEFSKPKPVKQP